MTDEHLRKVYILMSSMWRNEEELGVREQYRWGCRKDWGRILNRASHKRAGSIALRTTQAQVLLTSYFSFHGAANVGRVSISSIGTPQQPRYWTT
jgi:hypothetical protein